MLPDCLRAGDLLPEEVPREEVPSASDLPSEDLLRDGLRSGSLLRSPQGLLCAEGLRGSEGLRPGDLLPEELLQRALPQRALQEGSLLPPEELLRGGLLRRGEGLPACLLCACLLPMSA